MGRTSGATLGKGTPCHCSASTAAAVRRGGVGRGHRLRGRAAQSVKGSGQLIFEGFELGHVRVDLTYLGFELLLDLRSAKSSLRHLGQDGTNLHQ